MQIIRHQANPIQVSEIVLYTADPVEGFTVKFTETQNDSAPNDVCSTGVYTFIN